MSSLARNSQVRTFSYNGSLRTWADQWQYEKLINVINVKSTHQKEREEKEVERKAKEEVKRLEMKEAAAKAKRKAVEAKKKVTEEARMKLQRKTKHKKRLMKKIEKRQGSEACLLNQIERELDNVDLGSLEEELVSLEELERFEKQEANMWKEEEARIQAEKEEIRIRRVERLERILAEREGNVRAEMEARVIAENIAKNKTSEESKMKAAKEESDRAKKDAFNKNMLKSLEEQKLNAAKEFISQKRRKAGEEEKIIMEEAKMSAHDEMNKAFFEKLEDKVRTAKEQVNTTATKLSFAQKGNERNLHEMEEAMIEASKAAEASKDAESAAKLAAQIAITAMEKAKKLKQVSNESFCISIKLSDEAKTAQANYEDALEELNNLEDEVRKYTKKIEIVKLANPFLDFIKDAIDTKSLDLQCPVCLEEATSPIYSCPTRGHILCSSCRPALSQCPECREELGREWIRHRFAERTSDEIQGLRDRKKIIEGT